MNWLILSQIPLESIKLLCQSSSHLQGHYNSAFHVQLANKSRPLQPSDQWHAAAAWLTALQAAWPRCDLLIRQFIFLCQAEHGALGGWWFCLGFRFYGVSASRHFTTSLKHSFMWMTAIWQCCYSTPNTLSLCHTDIPEYTKAAWYSVYLLYTIFLMMWNSQTL